MPEAQAEPPAARAFTRSFSLSKETDDKLKEAAGVLHRSFSLAVDALDSNALFEAFEAPEEHETTGSEPILDDVPESPEGQENAPEKATSAAKAEDEESLAKKQLSKSKVMKDKITFVAGMANIAISCLWVGRAPSTFYIYYTIKCLALFGIRFPLYLKQKTHYYFFDFCYIVNALLILHCWIPFLWHWHWLFKALFACCAGPLAWSIPALRNSLVLHDMERTTSVFMHWSPAVVVFTLRWYPTESHPAYCPPGAEGCLTQTTSFLSLAFAPIVLYISWSVGYYLKIFVISEQKIRERGYDTVYSYMVRKGGMGSFMSQFSPGMRPVIYLAGHCAGCIVAFMLSVVFWWSFYAHCLLLALVSLIACWNGACFYFDYFAFRYVPSLGLEHKVANKKAD
mmetsp:Transcript_11366/g.32272  ORF Transcript_11366/g.32272 Transcript_11366/m.32272 type:complete len:397 (-) Transcript_11366:394-1584(-)|eukprot:CAMPEP_0117652736 /NCGR_PEP_ID=MMETSP0804-20121206/2795_1 /TAXON_ID=1074897 /ORGANISM="Tetraselmis astigmatica, Strain CCMP880" /LENGTH=396 /DNA_ID=CAMNT_0005458821 /DNA_START=223 /DNA_END=1413 /DNA_ORIENTATION=-